VVTNTYSIGFDTPAVLRSRVARKHDSCRWRKTELRVLTQSSGSDCVERHQHAMNPVISQQDKELLHGI
jgi:hypothetical protein